MGEVTYLEAIREGLIEEMERDSNVFCLGEDIGVYGGAFKVTEGLLGRFGADRVIDTPVSETGFVGAAAGAAHMWPGRWSVAVTWAVSAKRSIAISGAADPRSSKSRYPRSLRWPSWCTESGVSCRRRTSRTAAPGACWCISSRWGWTPSRPVIRATIRMYGPA